MIYYYELSQLLEDLRDRLVDENIKKITIFNKEEYWEVII